MSTNTISSYASEQDITYVKEGQSGQGEQEFDIPEADKSVFESLLAIEKGDKDKAYARYKQLMEKIIPQEERMKQEFEKLWKRDFEGRRIPLPNPYDSAPADDKVTFYGELASCWLVSKTGSIEESQICAQCNPALIPRIELIPGALTNMIKTYYTTKAQYLATQNPEKKLTELEITQFQESWKTIKAFIDKVIDEKAFVPE